MPTQRVLSPCRIHTLILTIPLLLLFAPAGSEYAQGPVAAVHAADRNRFEPCDLPAGGDDDVIKDALPAPPTDDDETRRKLCVTRGISNFEPSTAPPFRRPGQNTTSFSALDSLMESLLSGRPPPPSPEHT